MTPVDVIALKSYLSKKREILTMKVLHALHELVPMVRKRITHSRLMGLKSTTL